MPAIPICAGYATMKLRLSIGRAVNLFGLIVTLGCIAILWTGVSALGQLKVNGPIYRQIVLGKDLIADILPPPEYVIESYLESTLLLNDPASLASRRNRCANEGSSVRSPRSSLSATCLSRSSCRAR